MMKNVPTAGSGKMRKSLTGGLSPWESVTKPAEIVSMVSIKLTMQVTPIFTKPF